MFAFDDEAAIVLRRVGHAVTGRRVTPDDLRRILAAPGTSAPEPTRLQADPGLAALLQRAAMLAEDRSAKKIGRADLVEAAAEDAARARGLDLDRLRFARWRLDRAYSERPAYRDVREAEAAGLGGAGPRAEDGAA